MSDKRKCVISLGVNGPIPLDHPEVLFQDYSRGLSRIRQDLARVQFQGDYLCWDQRYPEGTPIQQEAHGAFKPFCFDEARKSGYQLVLWMDASIKIKDSVEPLFEYIRQDGYLIFREFHTVGEYCKDGALEPLGISREESFEMPSCRSGVLGLDLSCETSIEFLRQWKERATDGVTFPGPKWSGVFGWPMTASQDPRVKGHRYDQTAASVIAIKLGMNKWKSEEIFDQYLDVDRGYVRLLQEDISKNIKNETILGRMFRSGGRLLRKLR
jgi:hypothetical protein